MSFEKLGRNMNYVMAALASALLLGALGIQYIGRYQPCDICHWQRWPLFAAVFVGIIGGIVTESASPAIRKALISATILLVALSGAIGVYHSGIEFGWWPGPSHCTGNLFVLGAPVDPNAYKVVPCDKPTLFFGVSLANDNALISLGSAIIAALIVRKAKIA
jgi:disulfide bond formation protein DsbB